MEGGREGGSQVFRSAVVSLVRCGGLHERHGPRGDEEDRAAAQEQVPHWLPRLRAEDHTRLPQAGQHGSLPRT